MSEIEKLKSYHWPGNIRELENVIERQVILARGDIVRFDGLAINSESQIDEVKFKTTQIMTSHEIKQQEKNNIIIALKKCKGKIFGYDGAAELLGIKPTTLTSRLKKYNIDAKKYKKDLSEQSH